ncbi:MAG TPA: riboflavin synthase [Vicinamibacterales bacterium]
MFTGLVEAVGDIRERSATGAGYRLRISCPFASTLSLGDSLAVNGVCLTVSAVSSNEVQADIGPETVRVTTLGALAPGTNVNMERPLRADSRLGGHFVQGHVDGVGVIHALRQESDFVWLTVGFPRELAPLIVYKGSIAVDGISLTVARLGGDRLDVQIAPFTMDHTNLQTARSGDRVNLECDMVGKYVVRAMEVAGFAVAGMRPWETKL